VYCCQFRLRDAEASGFWLPLPVFFASLVPSSPPPFRQGLQKGLFFDLSPPRTLYCRGSIRTVEVYLLHPAIPPPPLAVSKLLVIPSAYFPPDLHAPNILFFFFLCTVPFFLTALRTSSLTFLTQDSEHWVVCVRLPSVSSLRLLHVKPPLSFPRVFFRASFFEPG